MQIAVIFEAQLMLKEISDIQNYENYFCSLYVRLLQSNDETIRSKAADCLFHFYIRKKQYEKAEEYLEYFSKQNPERKRKQAELKNNLLKCFRDEESSCKQQFSTN